jgi:CheY-like chemotaxis protein
MDELRHILYAEDDADIRQVAILALEQVGGFTVRAVENGQEVLDALKEFSAQLVLLDVMMPVMDGVSAYKRMQLDSQLAALPVVLMTARVQPAEVQQYQAIGIADVIEKPFDPMTLAERIRGIWNGVHA